MIPGFNHNIKHKGRIYHVQTEDSGPKHPHVITHLFVGGNIVASTKSTYAELLNGDYEPRVRAMMEEQHKSMLRSLINGAYDAVDVGKAFHLDGPAPLNFTAVSPTTNAMAGSAAFKGLPSQVAAGAGAENPQAFASQPPSNATHETPAAPQSSPPAPMARTSTPSPVRLGTPPFGNRPIGLTPLAELPTSKTPQPVSQPPQPATLAPPERRGPTTIFGDDLISEKSLDEVILSYLSEDLSELE
jgi:hypothetical protein